MCQTCAKLIDSDPQFYTREFLHAWKATAEARAAQVVASGLGTITQPIVLAIPSLDTEEALLSYASTAVPRIGRDAEMTELLDFLDDDRMFLWWVWTGPAGAGKEPPRRRAGPRRHGCLACRVLA